MAYFEEGSEAMVALEAMVDKAGLRNVLYALAHIAHAKADHIEANWQDSSWQDSITARIWRKRAQFFDDKASTILFSDE